MKTHTWQAEEHPLSREAMKQRLTALYTRHTPKIMSIEQAVAQQLDCYGNCRAHYVSQSFQERAGYCRLSLSLHALYPDDWDHVNPGMVVPVDCIDNSPRIRTVQTTVPNITPDSTATAKLTYFYTKHAPQKLALLPNIASKYVGHEKKLFQDLCLFLLLSSLLFLLSFFVLLKWD